jgi:demethylmenaquinone methyltransferase / 2-methoxy-6-polyprenyl-1,4-benzoquinol methylase
VLKQGHKEHTMPLPHASSFGFTPIDTTLRQPAVNKVFDSVASRYDIMNDAMSFGIHRLWKAAMIRAIAPRKQAKILDVAGGTADIALRLSQRFTDADITVADINPQMLQVGRTKAINKGKHLHFITGNAENLPLPANTFDLYTIAFGLRNVTHIEQALADAVRVLKPGGQFFCLEFSPSVNPLLVPLYDTFSFKLIPWLGEKIGHDRAAYQYLVESIRRFPAPEYLSELMIKAGMRCVRYTSYNGGIVCLHQGIKP